MKVPKPLLMTKLMSIGLRMAPDRTPAEAGLAYEDVEFAASDHLDIKGWFVPARQLTGPSAVPWCCSCTAGCGTGWATSPAGCPSRTPTSTSSRRSRRCTTPGSTCCSSTWSTTGSAVPGRRSRTGSGKLRDMLGAVAYLRTRDDVDGERIGVIGTSMGGNTALWAAPYCQPIKAILAVQPTRAGDFTARFAADQFGKLGTTMVKPIDWMYAAMRAPRPSKADPAVPARLLTDTMVKYVQGTGDPWGTMQNVQDMVDASPRTLPLVKYPVHRKATRATATSTSRPRTSPPSSRSTCRPLLVVDRGPLPRSVTGSSSSTSGIVTAG